MLIAGGLRCHVASARNPWFALESFRLAHPALLPILRTACGGMHDEIKQVAQATSFPCQARSGSPCSRGAIGILIDRPAPTSTRMHEPSLGPVGRRESESIFFLRWVQQCANLRGASRAARPGRCAGSTPGRRGALGFASGSPKRSAGLEEPGLWVLEGRPPGGRGCLLLLLLFYVPGR